MKRNLFNLLYIALFCGLVFIGFVNPAQASSDHTVGLASINLVQPAAVELAESFILRGTLRDENGRPSPDKNIVIYLDNVEIGQVRTNESGEFERTFNQALEAGDYQIMAVYKSVELNSKLISFTLLRVKDYTIQVQTVPAIAGVPFQIGENIFLSDENGVASLVVKKAGTYHLSVLVDDYQNISQKIEFGRWAEEVYDPFYDIDIPTNKVIQVGLDVFHRVSQTFVDLKGNGVNPNRISEFTIRSAQGDVFTFTNGQPRWIPASRVARRVNGLEETKLLYSVINVMVDGSNVVNQSQQRFYTQTDGNWEISLLLYSMRINIKDGLFGSPVGTGIQLQLPDGTQNTYHIDSVGMVEIKDLARGNYFIEPVGLNGMTNRIPVALSRDQDVTVKVITYLDILFVGLLGATAAIGMLLYGRPWILQAVLRKSVAGINSKQ